MKATVGDAVEKIMAGIKNGEISADDVGEAMKEVMAAHAALPIRGRGRWSRRG